MSASEEFWQGSPNQKVVCRFPTWVRFSSRESIKTQTQTYSHSYTHANINILEIAFPSGKEWAGKLTFFRHND